MHRRRIEESGPDWPVITVVTPSFNQADYLEKTICSVLYQGYPALEYIIVDGGSSDESPDIIHRYATKLHWWCSEPDDGQADAIAKGFDHSFGEVLCWLNSDDVLLPGALLAVGEYFRSHPHTEVANGRAYCIDKHGRPIRRIFQSSHTHGVRASARRLQFYGQDGVYQPATFWRRSAYFDVGGVRRGLAFAMDLDLFIRLAERQRFQVIPQYLACFRIHDFSKSGKMQHVRSSEVRLLRLERGFLEAHRARRLALYIGYRVASLLGKLWLQIMLVVGRERFPPLPECFNLQTRDHEQN